VKAAETAGGVSVFVGHQGGDDFVAVCDFDGWERLAGTFIALFDQAVARFYDVRDAERGYIEAEDRRGNRTRYEVATASVAVVTNQHRQFDNFGEIVKVAAEMKRLVKSRSGSNYAIDRRLE
jgi:hypothetical protein